MWSLHCTVMLFDVTANTDREMSGGDREENNDGYNQLCLFLAKNNNKICKFGLTAAFSFSFAFSN